MSTTTSAAPASTGAPPQGGIIEGLNPVHYNPKDPITLFIIQVGFSETVRHEMYAALNKPRPSSL